jgi:orotidine-5'-phosphate decarboxylase
VSRRPRGRERLIVALDTGVAAEALGWAEALRGEVGLVKVGLELFAAAGPDIVRDLRGRGLGVFLDLKLHDIPATVAGAVAAHARLGVEMTTLHAAGGRAMLLAAVAARDRSASPGLRLLAVTVLTSLDAAGLAEVGVSDSPAARAEALAVLALRCGADGAVCSPLEAERLRSRCGEGFLLVTPGVRPAGAGADDQARVATPAEAVRRGADYLVVGRPITRAADPRAAARDLVASLGEI